MRKQVKGIIALGVALAALGGGLAALKLTQPDDKELSSDASSVVEESSGSGIELVRKDPNTVNKVVVSNTEGSFTVERTAKATEEASATYTLSGYSDIPLDMYAISTIPNNLSDLYSDSIVEDVPTDLAKYGLENPVATAELFYDSGESVKAYIGDAAPIPSSTYFMLEGDEKVYTVATSKITNYCNEVTKFLNRTIVDEPSEDEMPIVKSLRIKREDIDYDIYIEYDERTADENYQGGTASSHLMIEPIKCFMGFESATTTIQGLFGLYCQDFYSVHPDENDMAETGLASPFCSVEMVCDNGKNYKFHLSESFTNDEGVKCHYFILEGIDVIYIVSAETAVWATVKPIEITSRNVFASTVWDIRELKISGRDIADKIITGDGTSKEDYVAKNDGKDLDTEHFRKFYAFMLSTAAEDLAFGKTIPENAEPVLSFSILDKNMTEPMVVEFYDDTEFMSLIVVDGECRYICTKGYVDTLAENIKRIDTGEEYIDKWKR